jgi:hypothetical protein
MTENVEFCCAGIGGGELCGRPKSEHEQAHTEPTPADTNNPLTVLRAALARHDEWPTPATSAEPASSRTSRRRR